MLKKYKFGFDVWAVVLFFLIMLPNFLWFAFPAPNDVLRAESVTPVVDAIGSVFQVVMIAALCFVCRKEKAEFALWQKIALALCVLLYYAGWAMYYCAIGNEIAIANATVILDLCLAPCLAFLLFSAARKNVFSFAAGICFALCHVWFCVANFL